MRSRRWMFVVGATASLSVAATVIAPHPHALADGGSADPRLASLAIDVRPVVVAAPGSARPGADGDLPEFGPSSGDETAITNADAWHAAGFTGAGVKIGVIDFFDVKRYWDVDEHGPKPIKGVTAKCYDMGTDCTWRYYDGNDEGGDEHGVAVVEVLRDMAPDAEIYVGSATTVSDYRRLIDWFDREGVTVVNRSLGSRYDGPGDGRGGLDDVAAYATSRGITWVNSGGNNGRGRYYRERVRLVDDRVAFGPSGTDTALEFSGCVSLGGIRWAADWDLPPAARSDYDAFLWDSPTGAPFGGDSVVVASSTADQRGGAAPLESFSDVACPSSSTRTLYLELRYRGGDASNDVIEVLDYGQGIAEYTQARYSASTPIADSRSPGVLAVGAVDPPDSGKVGYYSSQGPTNDGRIAPDLSAPSGFTSTIFASGFSGTSAAAPVVAGGAALLLDARLASDPASLGGLVRHLTVERGERGPDNVYGAGEFRLPEPPDATDATPSRYEPLDAPTRVLDTRPGTFVGPAALRGPVEAGAVLDLPLGALAPDDATAVAVNITVTENDRPAYLQVLPTLEAQVGGYSNLNLDAAMQTRANFAIVPVSADGSISLYLTAAGHVVIDLLGVFRGTDGAVDAGRFVALDAPERVLDTRDAGGRPLRSGRSVAVPWPAEVDHDEIDALVMTVTGTEASGPGWIQAYPTGRSAVVGTTSTVNVGPGLTVANTAIVPVGDRGASLAAFVEGDGSTEVVVDVVGYITSDRAPSSQAGRYVPVRPGRAYDSRRHGGELAAGEVVVVDADAATGVAVPDSADAVMWNIAHVGVLRPGFGRVWAADADEPPTSSFNFSAPGEVRAAAVISGVDGARARLVMRDGVGRDEIGAVVADVFGYFT